MHARAGTIGGMTLAYLVQHGEKEPLPGDPGLTGTGREQATRTGRWLRGLGIRALFSSPMRRARETAEGIASVNGLEVRPDARLRERLNWDGSLPLDAFLALWARTMRDRDWVPPDGESSRQAGTRLREFLAVLAGTPGPVAVVTHGGITLDLLRNLLGDESVPPPVLATGVPPCAVTAMDDLSVVMIASVAHLEDQGLPGEGFHGQLVVLPDARPPGGRTRPNAMRRDLAARPAGTALARSRGRPHRAAQRARRRRGRDHQRRRRRGVGSLAAGRARRAPCHPDRGVGARGHPRWRHLRR